MHRCAAVDKGGSSPTTAAPLSCPLNDVLVVSHVSSKVLLGVGPLLLDQKTRPDWKQQASSGVRGRPHHATIQKFRAEIFSQSFGKRRMHP